MNWDKFRDLQSEVPSNWREKAEWRVANRNWLRMSGMFAVSVLDNLEKKNISKEQLASMLGVDIAYIQNICKGNKNLTLKEICDIGDALCFNPFEIMFEYFKKDKDV